MATLGLHPTALKAHSSARTLLSHSTYAWRVPISPSRPFSLPPMRFTPPIFSSQCPVSPLVPPFTASICYYCERQRALVCENDTTLLSKHALVPGHFYHSTSAWRVSKSEPCSLYVYTKSSNKLLHSRVEHYVLRTLLQYSMHAIIIEVDNKHVGIANANFRSFATQWNIGLT